MKVHKTIYIEYDCIKEMEEFASTLKTNDGKEVKLSRLIEIMWEDVKEALETKDK